MTRAKGKRQAVSLNVWGTPRNLINADEFCRAEREWIDASTHPSYWRNNNGKR
jgi:hypothetical protein